MNTIDLFTQHARPWRAGFFAYTFDAYICEDGAIIAQNGALRKLEADTVLYALGMRPNDSHQLKQAAGNIPIYVIGDCLTPGKVGDAMKAAYELALTL